MDFGNMHQYVISREQRADILNYLIEYYNLHITDFGKFKSMEVLHMLFD